MIIGYHKNAEGTAYEVTDEMRRTCPDCGSENAYECPDPDNWGVLVCWCDDRNEGDEYA